MIARPRQRSGDDHQYWITPKAACEIEMRQEFEPVAREPWHFILSLALSISILASCGGETNVESGNRLGILHFGNGPEPQELDPHIVSGIPEHHIIVALLEGLVVKDPESLEPMPGVAESWTLSDDGRIYTFQLRQNARWSNGDRVTAGDFAWSWWRALQPSLGNSYAYMLFPIVNAEAYVRGLITDFDRVGIEVIDDFHLRVTLAHPTPYFLQLLDHYSTFPLHRATIEKFGNPGERGSHWTRPGNFVGNGPFMLDQWQLHKLVSVKKNPFYWDAKAVRLNGIQFHTTENISTEERMFRAGQLHHTETVPIDKIPVYREQRPELIHVAPYLGTYFYRFNTRVPHLRDKRVRQALSLAVDRRLLVEHVTRGGELPAFSFTPPNTLGYSASVHLTFDPERARALLAEAGYPDGKGFPVTEVLYNSSESHQKIAVAIQQMWKQHLNIDISLNNQDWKVFLNSVEQGDYSIARAGWIGDYVDPNTFLELWVTGSGNNRTGWSSAEYDRLVTRQAPAATGREQRYALLQQAEAILLDQLPVLPIYIYTSKHLRQPAVQGMPANLLDYALYKRVWLQPQLSNTEIFQ